MNNEIILEVFSKRLTELVNEHKTDVMFLAEGLGIKSASTIYRYMNGQMKPKLSTVRYLSEIFDVNPTWLMGYDVPKKKQSNIIPLPDSPVRVPVLGKISAGSPLLAEEHLQGYDFAPSSNIKEGFDYFYLIVKGDSMNLKFDNGDRVLVQKQDYLENGEIGVIMVNGDDATVKRFREENGMVILEPMSTNQEHRVQIYNPKEINIKIIGKVTVAIKNVN